MFEVFSADQLSEILKKERTALAKGEKQYMWSKDPVVREVLSEKMRDSDDLVRFIGLEGVENITGYHDFREQIQQYQLENNISGIRWKDVDFIDGIVSVPFLDSQLACLPEDLELLRQHRDIVFDAWLRTIKAKKLVVRKEFYEFRLCKQNHGLSVEALVFPDEIAESVQSMDWVEVYHRSPESDAYSLCLGVGDPAKVESDSDSDFSILFETMNWDDWWEWKTVAFKESLEKQYC